MALQETNMFFWPCLRFGWSAVLSLTGLLRSERNDSFFVLDDVSVLRDLVNGFIDGFVCYRLNSCFHICYVILVNDGNPHN